MKNKNLLIVTGVLGLGIFGLLLFKNKKSKDLQAQLKEEQNKIDFDKAVKEEAVAINIDLINEKKAKEIAKSIDNLWNQILKLPTGYTKTYKPYVELKNLIDQKRLEIKNLGYTIHESPRSLSGSTVTKK